VICNIHLEPEVVVAVAVAQVPVLVVLEVEEPVSSAAALVARKWELKQAFWQSVYFLVSAAVPVP
jgi:hypothetical protein